MADITGYRWRVWADTAATLTTQNPTLLSGEIVKESDTGYIKIGDGSTAWTDLDYFPPPIVRAEYYQDTAQTITATQSQIDFEEVTEDTHNAVTTGSSWKFTAPIDGVYQVSCVLLSTGRTWQLGTYGDIRLYKNDVEHRALDRPAGDAIAATINLPFQGSASIRLAKGDYIDVRMDRGTQTANYTLSGVAWRQVISIDRIGN